VAFQKIRLLGLVWATFFSISLVTNILGPLIPDLIRDFHLSLSLAALLPSSLFLAYGLCSIPAGLLVERCGDKAITLLGFALVLVGALAFALVGRYAIAIASLFTIGVGMALLQVVLNPLLRAAGGEARFAFYAVLGQLVFGVASFVSPFLYSYLTTRAKLSWISLYWVFAGIAATMLAWVAATPFPAIARTAEAQAGSWKVYLGLLRRPMVIAYFVGIFAYVGTEQGLATWMSEFLHACHGLDPRTDGARAVAWFWGLMTCGCVLGLFLLRRFDSRAVLAAFTLLALLLLGAGLFGPTPIARWALPLCGFAASVMWSVIFSLALNSVPEHHGAFSGILCTAIVGGAAVSGVIGWLGDQFGLRAALLVLFLTLGYILSVARWARPLVVNEIA